MENREFLALSSLFDAIGIIEKGIEKIYHHLLKNKRIDNLNEVAAQYDLTLKRGYKICAVLNELELVQIYDRPMKIHLATPIIPLWQKIVNGRIEELTKLFQEEKEKAEEALDEFIQIFNLGEPITQEFVEFIKYNLQSLDETYHSFLSKEVCKIAIGIRYDNELVETIKKFGTRDIPAELKDFMRAGMIKISNNLKNLNMQIIFNAELIKELLLSPDFEILTEHLIQYDLKFKSISVHVTYDDFSNFNLTDNELIQPSFDPTNRLIGSYVSRNKNIFQIFYDKFNELYEKGIPLNQFIQDDSDIHLKELSDTQKFLLCIL
jgi:hypothetical protein